MRVDRLVVDGFGPLEGVDLAWNEGELLLVLEPNETGKSTLCEAIVAALYGLPKGRAAGGRSREARKPRSGAPTRLRIDVSSSAGRFSVERDFDAGTLRVVDRDRGEDRTAPEPDVRPDRATAEGRFALEMEARIAAAPDLHARRVAELALALGRDALAGRLPSPPAVEDL